MANQQPVIVAADGRRQFACSAAAVVAFVINQQEQILLLSNPRRPNQWEVINGALDREESILDAVLREIREEAGSELKVRPLGTVHSFTVRYDDNVQYMLSICYLLAYEDGAVIPGDDMAGSQYRWCSLTDIASLDIIVPRPKWLFQRAVELYRLWKDQSPVGLEPGHAPGHTNKYGY